MEIEGLDPGVALQSLRLEDRNGILFLLVGRLFALDIGHIVHFLAEHLADKLNTGKVLDLILAHELAVPKHRDLIADLIDLVQEVGNKDNTDALAL